MARGSSIFVTAISLITDTVARLPVEVAAALATQPQQRGGQHSIYRGGFLLPVSGHEWTHGISALESEKAGILF